VEPRLGWGSLGVTRRPGPSLDCDALGHATFVSPQRRAASPDPA
jgi:hypothetical protein